MFLANNFFTGKGCKHKQLSGSVGEAAGSATISLLLWMLCLQLHSASPWAPLSPAQHSVYKYSF